MIDRNNMEELNEERPAKVLPAWQRVVFATASVESFSSFSRLLPVRCQDPLWCISVREVMSALSVHDIAVVACSASLADGSFRDLFRVLHLARWYVPVIVIFPAEQPEQESEAILLGAFGCINPRSEQTKISQIFARALAQSLRPYRREQAGETTLAATRALQ